MHQEVACLDQKSVPCLPLQIPQSHLLLRFRRRSNLASRNTKKHTTTPNQQAIPEQSTQKFDKINTSDVTPPPVSPLCEVCGVFGHIGIDCQLGSATNGVEQMNYAQYNQGMRQNQNFYKNQNPYGQVAQPGYANNQRFTQKSNLEILLENSIANQKKQLQELKNQRFSYYSL